MNTKSSSIKFNLKCWTTGCGTHTLETIVCFNLCQLWIKYDVVSPFTPFAVAIPPPTKQLVFVVVVSNNVCLPLSFFRDILPSPKHTQQQHTPYNLIQLFRSTLRPANAMWSLIKPQNVAVCELLKTIPFGGCQKIWRFVDVNASSCATRTNFCGVRFVLIDNCWNRSRLVFRARCHFAIMARRLGATTTPRRVCWSKFDYVSSERECIRRMDRTIW